ncbi:hypothetical protein [Ruegeria atlantica]|uniref:hypothetical protein n=1 Tax=Ruegeria atlantica TaxID=81569 RepID=UPI0014817537|nr:hypothetical protein [Ruegeria atlantica]
MTSEETLLAISNFVRIVGVNYVPALVIATLGLFPGFGKSLASKLKYAQAEARIRRQKFGWGVDGIPVDDVKFKYVVLLLLVILPVVALILFGLAWLKEVQNPALNIIVGSGFFLFGLSMRRQFIRGWDGSKRKLDFACFLIGLLFVFNQTF